MRVRRILVSLAVIAAWYPCYLFGQAAQSVFAPEAAEALKAAAAKRAEVVKAAAAKPTPRTADGHPDLSGNWFSGFGPPATQNGSSFFYGITKDGIATPVKLRADDPNAPPYKPELFDKIYDLNVGQPRTDPTFSCDSPGVPRIGSPHQIVQSKNLIVFLYADLNGSFYRAIPTDGRAHNPDADETSLGDSVAHWDKDTLVVDVTSFNDDTWLGDDGLIHSKKLHVIEKLRRVGDTLEYQATVEDPEVLRKPWDMKPRTLLLTNAIISEAPPCKEMDVAHFVDEGRHHGNPR